MRPFGARQGLCAQLGGDPVDPGRDYIQLERLYFISHLERAGSGGKKLEGVGGERGVW